MCLCQVMNETQINLASKCVYAALTKHEHFTFII